MSNPAAVRVAAAAAAAVAAAAAAEDSVTADIHAPMVPERCILIGMVGLGVGVPYESHLLMGRVQRTRFITLDTSVVLLIEDLAEVEIIPTAGGQPYPVECIPLLAFGVSTDAIMDPQRARVGQLLEMHGGTART